MLGLLSGARILDLSHMLAGPFGTMMMGDLGAEIIKIEPRDGDPLRQMGPHFLAGESVYYLSANRSKKSIVLNLQHAQGRKVFYDLVKTSDVVYENFRPGVTQKLGIDYATLKRINPRVIYCSLSGFGQNGPSRDRPAFDIAIQGLAGAMSITGTQETPVRMGIAMGDLAGGMYAAFAVASALYHREETDEGCYIDLALMDCLVSLLTYVAQYYFYDGIVPGPQGTEHMFVVPYQRFKTTDGFLVVAAFTEKFWQGLCRALEMPHLIDDPRYINNDARREHKVELLPILADAFATRPLAEWARRLDQESVPWGPVNTLDRVFADPQIAARRMKIELDHPTIGKLPMVGNPVKVQGVDEKLASPPLRGQHTAEILSELLGYSSEQIAVLEKEQVI